MNKILYCTCEQAHQDDMYGQGQRNHRQEGDSYVCTICGNEKTLKAPDSPPETPKAIPAKKAKKA